MEKMMEGIKYEYNYNLNNAERKQLIEDGFWNEDPVPFGPYPGQPIKYH